MATAPYSTTSQKILELKFAQAELKHLQSLQHAACQELEREGLEQVTGIHDGALLDRLRSAGFTTENIYALTWLPVAMVAWASHGVSHEESSAAKLVNLYAVFTGNSSSVRLFESWLKKRPNERMVKLWEDYTRYRLSNPNENWQSQTGSAIFFIARKVAEASGGLFGLGQISPAEQRVLDRIKDVYEL